MTVMKFKRALLWTMGYINMFASIVSICLAASNASQSCLFVIFMIMSTIFVVLGIICLYGEDKVRTEIIAEKERRKREAMETFRRARESMKEAMQEGK